MGPRDAVDASLGRSYCTCYTDNVIGDSFMYVCLEIWINRGPLVVAASAASPTYLPLLLFMGPLSTKRTAEESKPTSQMKLTSDIVSQLYLVGSLAFILP